LVLVTHAGNCFPSTLGRWTLRRAHIVPHCLVIGQTPLVTLCSMYANEFTSHQYNLFFHINSEHMVEE